METHSCLTTVGTLDHTTLCARRHVDHMLTHSTLHKQTLPRTRRLEGRTNVSECLQSLCVSMCASVCVDSQVHGQHREEEDQHWGLFQGHMELCV